jgi:thymidylate synthase (FAD)
MKVLDKGHVEIVDHMGSDLTVCNAARVSFNSESEWCEDTEAIDRLKKSGSQYYKEDVLMLCEKDKKLIRYLARHKHWTPFAHPQITLRIKAPISIRTQFFKHKQGFVENEISRRYVSYEPEFYYPEWRGKPTNGAKQGSDDFIDIDKETKLGYENAIRSCMYTYGQLLENGVAPEQARFVLPQGMYTEWYWTGSLAAYARFYSQRIDEHAQWEIREYAKAISSLVRPLFPESWKELTYINDPVKSNTENK